jgi:hypothetical protein
MTFLQAQNCILAINHENPLSSICMLGTVIKHEVGEITIHWLEETN